MPPTHVPLRPDAGVGPEEAREAWSFWDTPQTTYYVSHKEEEMRSKLFVMLALLLVIGLILPGCTASQPQQVEKLVTQVVEQKVQVVQTVEQVVQKEKIIEVTATPPPAPAGPKTLRLAWGPGDIPTIDPALAVDVISIQIIEETTVGLVRQDETNAQVDLGMATEHQVSDDGLVHTFKLLNDVPWVRYDGQQVVKVPDCEGKDRVVTANDFAYGILRTLNPATASDYAYVLTPVIAGAKEFNEGTITDTAKVGVQAVDPTTLVITTTTPAVYNLNILGLWVAHAQPKWLIEGDDCTQARGERWTETGFFQGYGPYTLKEWVHDASLALVKNPFWPGTDSVPVATIDEVNWTFLDTTPAFAEFEAGNLDVAGVPLGDMDRIKADPQYKNWLDSTPTLGTEFYAFNTKLAPTDDPRVRQALSLAIDRQSLVENVNKGSGTPAQWFTNPGAAGAPQPDKYPDLGVKYDPAKAKELMDAYLAEKGTTADKLNIVLMFNTSEAHKQRAEAVQQMWKDTLGVSVQLANQEWKVYLQQRREGNENIYRGSWVQDYPDANNFLWDVFGPGGGYADVVDWQDDKFNELLTTAAQETDPAKRMALYADAEKILVNEQAVVAPLYWYSTPTLYRPNVKYPKSITGYDHYEKWTLD
jgi:oligopeptide transport system substrate-binding protein